MNASKRVPLYLMMLIVALPQLSETIYTPSLPAIAAALHTTANWVEHTLTIYLLGFACGVFLWGTLSDRFGRKPGLFWGLGIYALASLGCFFSATITMLMVMRFLQAFGASTGSVLGQAIARDSSSLAERGKLFSTISLVLAFAPAVGPLIGSTVEGFAGWQGIFLALIALAGIVMTLIALQLPETHTGASKNSNFFVLIKEMLPRVSRDIRLLMSGVLIGGVNGILFGYYAEAPFYFKKMLGVPDHLFGMLSMYVVLPLAAGSLISRTLHTRGWQADSISLLGVRTILGCGLLFYGAACLPIVHMPVVYTVVSMLCVSGTMTGLTMVIPNVLGQALERYKENAGTAASLFGLYYYIWISLFTGLMAVLHNGTLQRLPLFFVIIGISLMVAYKIGGFGRRV